MISQSKRENSTGTFRSLYLYRLSILYIKGQNRVNNWSRHWNTISKYNRPQVKEIGISLLNFVLLYIEIIVNSFLWFKEEKRSKPSCFDFSFKRNLKFPPKPDLPHTYTYTQSVHQLSGWSDTTK